MRRLLLLSPVVALVALTAVSLARCAFAPAAPGFAPADPPAAHALPVREVVLFNSGVGYFRREGHVDGDTKVELQFARADVNDLIKSLTVADAGGGRVRAVAYDNPDQIDRTLRSFALDLSGNPSFAQLVNMARGETVEVFMKPNTSDHPGAFTGQVLGLESRHESTPHSTQDVEMLNLLCAEGVRHVTLSQVQRLRFLDARLERELRRALGVLARGRDAEKKAVTIDCVGTGRRAVSVGYVAEHPVWKTSYRLALGPDGPPRLSALAAVENTTDDDWNDVRVVLVSGRPVSFAMDMHSPLRVPRPTVEPELFAMLRPPAYQAAASRSPPGLGFGAAGAQGFGPRGQVNLGAGGGFGGYGGCLGANRFQNQPPISAATFIGGGALGNAGAANPGANGPRTPVAVDPPATGAEPPPERLTFEDLQRRREEARQVGPAAAGRIDMPAADWAGQYFRLTPSDRVNLPRQMSALLPVLDRTVGGRRVSVYNQYELPKHPLLALRLKNTTGGPLVQGPAAVSDNGEYAGDARVPDLADGEERLIAYAADLLVDVETSTSDRRGPNVKILPQEQALFTRSTLRRATNYAARNRSPRPRSLIVEHPTSESLKLVSAAPTERTPNTLRYELTVPAGQSAALEVAEDHENIELSQPKQKENYTSYTTEFGLEVRVSPRTFAPEFRRAVAAPEGVRATSRHREALAYHLVNDSDEPRVCTVWHPVRAGWSHAGPGKPVPGNTATFEYSVPVAARNVARLEVPEERDVVEVHPWRDDADAGGQWAGVAGAYRVTRVSGPGEVALQSARVAGVSAVTEGREQRTTTFRYANESDRPTEFAVDHPGANGWQALTRQELALQRVLPGASASADVAEGRAHSARRPLAGLAEADLRRLLAVAGLSPEVREVFARAAERRAVRAEAERQLAAVEKQLRAITEDQTRLRQNLDKVPASSAAHKRYLDKFDAQETEVERLQGEAARLRGQLDQPGTP